MQDDPDAVMLFAAGFGTRMQHLTADQPKPMIPVAGKPLIDHALDLVAEIAPARIVANLHYKPEPLRAHLQDRPITLIEEQPNILETGGGLRNALPALGAGPVYTMNTDAIWSGPNPLSLLRDAWRPDQMEALLMLIPPEQALSHTGKGDFWTDADGRLHRGPGFVYGGVQILKTERLPDMVETAFSLNVLWDRMRDDGTLFGVRYPGRWCDVGHPGGIDVAEAMLKDADV